MLLSILLWENKQHYYSEGIINLLNIPLIESLIPPEPLSGHNEPTTEAALCCITVLWSGWVTFLMIV
jgi:hypothetical protein